LIVNGDNQNPPLTMTLDAKVFPNPSLGIFNLNVKSSSNDHKRPTCEHCGKVGHTEDRCWAKHPDLKNSAPFKKARVNSVSSSSDIPNKEKVIKDAHNLVKSAQNNKSIKK
jgi:hypothetical protein